MINKTINKTKPIIWQDVLSEDGFNLLLDIENLIDEANFLNARIDKLCINSIVQPNDMNEVTTITSKITDIYDVIKIKSYQLTLNMLRRPEQPKYIQLGKFD